jgi:hypothetical protein
VRQSRPTPHEPSGARRADRHIVSETTAWYREELFFTGG